LRRLRLERGLSQRQLAAPGVSYAYISRIEADQRRPSLNALRKLALKLGVSPDELETGSPLRDADRRELRLAEAEFTLRLGEEPSGPEKSLRAVAEEALENGDIAGARRARIALGLAAERRGDAEEAVTRSATRSAAARSRPRPDPRPMLPSCARKLPRVRASSPTSWRRGRSARRATGRRRSSSRAARSRCST
jgi:transcriptional regulator with XRE-family HTH domain